MKDPVYQSYLQRKKNGEQLDLEKVPVKDVEIMFDQEIIFNYQLADLFDVSEYRMQKYRNAHGLTLHQLSFKQTMNKCAHLFVAAAQAEKIKSMTNEERNSLFDYLAIFYPDRVSKRQEEEIW